MKKQEKPDKPMENNCNLTIRVDARLLERADALIDVEKFTNARWGVQDGTIQWADLGPTKGGGCSGN